MLARGEGNATPEIPWPRPPSIGMFDVGGAMDVEEGDRRGRCAVVDAERARLTRGGHEHVGGFAHQPVGHDHPVRVTGREDAARIESVLGGQLLHECTQERHVVDGLLDGRAAAHAAVPRAELVLGRARADAVGVDDEEPVRRREVVEPARALELTAGARAAVQRDEQRDRFAGGERARARTRGRCGSGRRCVDREVARRAGRRGCPGVDDGAEDGDGVEGRGRGGARRRHRRPRAAAARPGRYRRSVRRKTLVHRDTIGAVPVKRLGTRAAARWRTMGGCSRS